LRSNSQYIELTTQKSGVLFTTAALKHLSQSYQSAQLEYAQAQKALVKEIIAVTSTYFPVLELLNADIAKLDVILSFATATCFAPIRYTKPRINAFGGVLKLVGSRHACLEMQDGMNVIPNDAEFTRKER
jgi:DNA mismatch repair protein MSH2